MAILRSHGVMLVDSIPTHTPTTEQAKLARLQDTLTFYYYDGSAWVTVDIDAINADSDVESVTGPTVDNTDPLNPVIGLQTATQTSVLDSAGNYTATDVEGALAEIATQFSGLAHTSITNIDLKSTGTANEYTVEVTWVDEDNVTQTTTDATPITISGITDLSYTASPTDGVVVSSTGNDATISLVDGTNAGLMSPGDKALVDSAVQTVADTNSIDLTKTGTEISADLKVSATQSGATVSVLADGLSIAVDPKSPWDNLDGSVADETSVDIKYDDNVYIGTTTGTGKLTVETTDDPEGLDVKNLHNDGSTAVFKYGADIHANLSDGSVGFLDGAVVRGYISGTATAAVTTAFRGLDQVLEINNPNATTPSMQGVHNSLHMFNGTVSTTSNVITNIALDKDINITNLNNGTLDINTDDCFLHIFGGGDIAPYAAFQATKGHKVRAIYSQAALESDFAGIINTDVLTTDIDAATGKVLVTKEWIQANTLTNVKPPAYDSRALATAALGTDAQFIYTAANLDGATEGSVAWT